MVAFLDALVRILPAYMLWVDLAGAYPSVTSRGKISDSFDFNPSPAAALNARQLSTNGLDPWVDSWCENEQNVNGKYEKGIGLLSKGWMSVDCSKDSIVNKGGNFPKEQRWNDADALNAYGRAYMCYSTTQQSAANLEGKKFGFSRMVANFFHVSDGMKCDLLDDSLSQCTNTRECSEAGHAAGFQVINSLVEIHNFHQRIKTDLLWISGNLTARIPTMATTFSPNEDKLRELKIILDVVGMVFAVAAAPVWNNLLKGGVLDTANTLGATKDAINGIVAGGISLGKDTAKVGNAALATQNSLQNRASLLVGELVKQIEAVNAKIFDGSYDSYLRIATVINQGAMLEYDYTQAKNDERKGLIESALWASLIPMAWAASNNNYYPFISQPADWNSPQGCQYTPPDSLKNAYMCYDNRAWVLQATGPPRIDAESCVNPGGRYPNPHCTRKDFKQLPGLDQMTEGNRPWGVTVTQMISSAVAGWQINQEKNGYVPPDVATSEMVNSLAGSGPATPGFVRIPVCSQEEAYKNWRVGNKIGDNYPCND